MSFPAPISTSRSPRSADESILPRGGTPLVSSRVSSFTQHGRKTGRFETSGLDWTGLD